MTRLQGFPSFNPGRRAARATPARHIVYNSSMAPIDPGLQDIRYLAGNELFKELQPTELASVAQAGRRRRAKANSYLFRQGDPSSAIYILVEGQVKLSQVTPEGHQVLLRVAGPGDLLGAVAVLEDSRYPATAQAADDCRLLSWDGAAMLALMQRFPQVAINALRIVSGRVREFQDRYRELATERVERRLARALLRLAGQAGRKTPDGVLIDLALTRQDLAEMTGATRFTISRMLTEWESRGIIEASRVRVLIKRPHELVVIAEDLPQPATARSG
jgi:CRP-like cAMP-binding protein